MKRLQGTIGLVLVLALAAASQATLVKTYSITGELGGTLQVNVDFVGSYAVLGGQVDTYDVRLYAPNAADTITAVDVEFVGSMYQVKAVDTDAVPPYVLTPDMDRAQDLSNIATDSHLLPGWIVKILAPAEDNDVRYGLNAAGELEGIGTTLSVVSGISGSFQTRDLALAHVAIPRGQSACLMGEAADGTGERFSFASGLAIPEPGALALCAAGALALLRRRWADGR